MVNTRIFSLTAPVRRGVAGVTLAGLAVTATYIGQGLLMAQVLTLLFARAPLAAATLPIAAILALMLLRAGLQWLHQWLAARTAATVKHALRGRLYAHLLELGPGYLERTRTGRVQSTLVDGVESLERYIGFYIPQVFIVLIGPALIVIALATIDWVAGLLILVALLLVLVGPHLFEGALGERATAHWNAYRELNAQFLDTIQGMSTLKAFNAADRRGAQLHHDAVRLYRSTMHHMAISLISTGITGLGMTAGSALVVGVSALRLSQGAITVPQLFAILFLGYECLRPLDPLLAYWHQALMGLAGAKGVFGMLDTRPEIAGGALADAPIVPELAFEEVVFGYAEGERPALRGLSFHIAPGETVALVGRSGAGKTTVVSLLLRYFDPQAGRIRLGGRDLRDYPLERLRTMFAVVSQDTYLFHGTVAENLRLARPAAGQAELEAAARAANAHEFIAALPQGYDTNAGERGAQLSGGQRQRLAIARAFLRDAPILVMDEAVSNLDTENERLLQAALSRLRAGRTTLIIAHRLSTIRSADRLVVLEGGRVAEAGTHAELLARAGIYARLIAHQRDGLLIS